MGGHDIAARMKDYFGRQIAWFDELSKLPYAGDYQLAPPGRDELIRLFDRVKFHPLSICVLAQQLKTRTADQLGQRLEEILGEDAF